MKRRTPGIWFVISVEHTTSFSLESLQMTLKMNVLAVGNYSINQNYKLMEGEL